MITEQILQSVICCPFCKDYPLYIESIETEQSYILRGKLTCKSCSRYYHIERGISTVILRRDPHHTQHFDKQEILHAVSEYFSNVEFKMIDDVIFVKARKG